MGVFRQFPYSNFHEMNLDEMIKIIKNMLEEWAQYHAEWDAWMTEINEDWSNYQEVMNEAWQNMQDFINNYFDNLDVQEEINNKIVSMVASGEFASIVAPYIPPRVTEWLTAHITQPEGVVIDTSLTVAGACADAKATGNAIINLNKTIKQIDNGLEVYADGWTDTNYYNGQGQLISANTYWRTNFIPIADFEKVISRKNGLGVYCAYFDSSYTFQAMSGGTYDSGDIYTLATSYTYVVIEILKTTGSYADIDIVGYENKIINNNEVITYTNKAVDHVNSQITHLSNGLNIFNGSWTDNNHYDTSGVLITDDTYWRTNFIPVSDFKQININANNLFMVCVYFNEDETYANASYGATLNNGDSYTLATSYHYVVIEILKSSGSYSDIDIIGNDNKAINNDVIRSEISYNDLLLDTTLENKLTAVHGKNLYNPNTFNQLDGYYFAYNNGIRTANSGFIAVVIPVTAGDILSFNKGNIHVCALSKIPDLSYFADHSGRLEGYISGFADAQPKQNYTVPNDCVCLVVSNPKTEKLTIQVEVGSASTSFEAYYSKLYATDIIGINAEFVVGQGLLYETITDAINDASDGDTIYVTAGIYTEAIDARGKKIKIKGFSRDECILTYPASDYLEPPLEMAKGVVEDMTIIATGSTLAPEATYLAYCVHIDFGEERNNSLQFKNCRFVNEARQCVGIGMRENYRLSFINCEFECDTDSCIYLHEEQASNVNGQYVEFIDCSMKRNSNGSVIRMQESPAYTNNNATVRFQRNILINTGGAVIIMDQYGSQPGLTGNGYLGSTNWTLDSASALNNSSLLDA